MTDGTIIRDMLDELAAIARRRDRAQQNGAVAARVGGARDGASQYAGVDGMMDCVVRAKHVAVCAECVCVCVQCILASVTV